MISENTIEIEWRSIDTMTPYINNARSHSERQIEQIAASIKEFGFTNPVLVDGGNGIIAGHGRVMAAQSLGMAAVPCLPIAYLTDAQKRAYIIADNQLALTAGWDDDLLKAELQDLQALDFNMDLLGFDDGFLEGLLEAEQPENPNDADHVPEPPAIPVSKLGDIWLLGQHRVLCGDSTSIDAVNKLMNGQKAALLHADPPYGMGKENEGIANDNLYREKLDVFQMVWWKAYRPMLEENASAYIWGCAPDLWRLWYQGGLNSSERLTFRNQIIWGKEHGQGMLSEAHRMFPTVSEHALFFMLGEQGFNNNADNYWDGWDTVVNYLKNEKEKTGWDIAKFKRLAGHSETSGCHWFDKSQWNFPTKEVYKCWQAAANGNAFKREYDDLKREYDDRKREYDDRKREFYNTRAYFDNTHEIMTDIWKYQRVQNEARHGHATPKPVAMMERIMMSSLPKNGLGVEPFLGSGSTLIAAEKTNRICYGMEISPAYVDVIVSRWQDYTGKQAIRDADGKTFNIY